MSPVAQRPAADGIVFEDTTGATTIQLMQASASDLVTHINDAAGSVSLLPLVILLCLPLITIPVAVWLHARDKARRTVVAFYDIQDIQAQKFQMLVNSFTAMQHSSASWHVIAQGNIQTTRQYKTNAGASNLIRRIRGRADIAGPPLLATNIAVPSLHARKRSVYFLPDRLLIRDGRRYADLPYSVCQVSGTQTRYIETSRRPADSQQIERTWRYVNKGGGPDRRYKNNPQLPVMLYSELNLAAAPGFHFIWQASRADAAPAVAAALTAMKT
jgi:hypothetical protein